MARQKGSTKSVKSTTGSSPSRPQRGMPAKDSVKDVVDFVSPQGVPYKILKTTETDAYDPPLPTPKKRRTHGDS